MVGTDTTSKSFRFGDFEYVRELLVVEVYTSAAPLDAEQDAIVAPPWSTVPWHLLVLMEEAVDARLGGILGEPRRAVAGVRVARSRALARHQPAAGCAGGELRA